MIVGLHGFAQSGKDTIGQELVEKYGFERLSFADIIREALYILNPILSHNPMGDTLRVQDVVDEHGWEWSKKQYSEVRRLLQVIGTDVGRDLIYPAIWIDGLRNKIRNGDYVITDVRFENEAEMIRSNREGLLVKIIRDGVGPVNSHSSDKGLPDTMFDLIINNDGSLEEFLESVEKIAYLKSQYMI
jgi:hypothetical protein